jgi:hypothetical protein
MSVFFQSREDWLVALTKELQPLFISVGAKIPDRVRTSMSLTRGKKSIGICFDADNSKDQTYEILIRIDKDDPMEVAEILVHELIHASVGLECRHGGEFKRVALDLGLEGKMTATHASDALQARLQPILDALGAFPHASLDLGGRNSTGPKKQGTRMKKVTCEECGYTVRVANKWIQLAVPECPMQHGVMKVEEEKE